MGTREFKRFVVAIGFVLRAEARPDKADRLIQDSKLRRTLREWWLAVPSRRAETPNWDIASTCVFEGQPGILLFEAKAHDVELRNEERGKPLVENASQRASNDSLSNHESE